MSKRPFNKIRKIEKKQNIDLPEETKEEQNEEQNIVKDIDISKPPIFNPQKKRINIASNEALKNNEDNAIQVEPKISLGSKPSLFKGKKEGGKLIINSNRISTHNEPVQENHSQAPKPTPLVIKKRGNLDFRNRQRQNIIIQEEEQSQRFNIQESKEINVEESINKKPDLKIKRLNPRRQFSQRADINQESAEFNRSNQQPPSQMESYTPALMEYREINIEPSTGISQGKIDKQKKRTNQLKNLLNLEIDLYEQTLSIGNVTAYEIYINKIRGGYLKNSQDQAFDQQATNSCQTLSFEYADFTNQCPQDYSVDVNRIQKLDSNHIFDQFVLKIAPLIEQLIKPTNSITQPPIFLLAFRPVFKSFLKCPYPIFIYHSQQFALDLLVIGEKLYITEGEISSVLMIGKTIIGGLKSGHLILWNGQNKKSSRLYHQIKQFTNTTNFQLPAYSTHHLQKFSPFASDVTIVALSLDERSNFSSLDANGKIVKWIIEEQANGSQTLKAIKATELRNMVQRSTLKAYSMKKRGQSLYINTSMGIIWLQNNQIKQKLINDGIKIVDFEIPKRSPLVFTISENNSLQIYNQLYSYRLFHMELTAPNEQLVQIIIPELEHQNREIVILQAIYLIGSLGSIFEVKLLQNQYQSARKLGQQQDSRQEKNVIFRGVNRQGQLLQSLRLMRDLKLKTQSIKMGIKTQKSVANLKLIIEKNRQLMTLLEKQNALII